MKGFPSMRKLSAIVALFLLLAAWSAGQAGQEPLAGNWQVTFFSRDAVVNLWIIKIEAKDGKLSGTVISNEKVVPAGSVKELTAKEGQFKAVLQLKDGPEITFACKLPKGQIKKLHGTMSVGKTTFPVQLASTKLDSLKDVDPETKLEPKGDFKELRQAITKEEDDIRVFGTAVPMIAAAAKAKAPVAELKEALAVTLKAAGEYSDAWLQHVQFKLAGHLVQHEAYAGLGEELAQEVLKNAGAKASPVLQIRAYGVVADALEKQGKKADAAKTYGVIAGLYDSIAATEQKDFEASEKVGLGFTPAKFEGRKGNKTVLVELFTGAQCPPCVAADVAFEALSQTYSTKEVVLLQYHLHIPGPDPMTNSDTEARQRYYEDEVGGTPAIMFNGKSAGGGGGPKSFAENKYKEYRGIIDPLLDEKTAVKLSAAVQRQGDDISVTATASGYKASDKTKLRFALVEAWVRYPGGNGLVFHAHVVRAMPGGPAGFALNKDNAKETAKVNLAELRQVGAKALDEIPSLEGLRPFNFRNLRMVAFIQDDATKEVLAAVEVPVK
jgi:hypothetical protein